MHEGETGPPARAAGNRGAGGTNDCRVEPVHVKAQVNLVRELRGQELLREAGCGKVGGIQKVDGRMMFAKLRLGPREGAAAELEERKPQIIHGPAGDAGVAEFRALVRLPQIGMGIDLDQAKGPVAAQSGQRPERAQAGRMFAAQQHGQALLRQDRRSRPLYAGKRRLHPAAAVNSRAGVDARLQRTGMAVPILELLGGGKNRSRSPGRAAAVGNRGLQRHGQHMKARLGPPFRTFRGKKIRHHESLMRKSS